MNAVVFDGPYKVSLQERPVPQSKPADALATGMHTVETDVRRASSGW